MTLEGFSGRMVVLRSPVVSELIPGWCPATFHLPAELQSSRSRADPCRLLVSDGVNPHPQHEYLRTLPRLLSEGDVFVVNTSGALGLEPHQSAAAVHSPTGIPWAAWALSGNTLVELMINGVLVVPLLLDPQTSRISEASIATEFFSIPECTARIINAAKLWGKRVIAAGTTVLRALETAGRADGSVQVGGGPTDLVFTPDFPMRVADGLLTSLHPPRTSHLAIIEAFIGFDGLVHSYDSALSREYLWGQWGDRHLLFRHIAGRRSPAVGER